LASQFAIPERIQTSPAVKYLFIYTENGSLVHAEGSLATSASGLNVCNPQEGHFDKVVALKVVAKKWF